MRRENKELGAFIGIMRGSSKLERIVKRDVSLYQLNITEFSVMELLFHQGRQTTQTIKDKILIASSSTTYVIDQLEKKGCVTRITNPADKRITYVELSEKGRTLMEEIFPLHVNTISDCFSSLEEEELTQFVKTLAKINRKLDKQL
ncbi:MarR family winged helix-turn-helix transcriptional regulator [Vagococcus fluvialis]|uniref:MarR family winged helix-turn-helix transcriptional regulator n=1 Tax=Vagococcus fluvialis TaxID=2738 RepID=UPI001A8C3167|nr:MarR family transcriptional regulator [Vagococcus fluvialis]MBO0438236.1 MarR family transcriptional regulator [Vagococcus fluvialis]